MLTDFFTAFISVGLAELGDKTQIALLLISSKSGRKISILTGAFLGFLLVDGVAVVAGSWISTMIRQELLKTVSALVFILFGILTLRGAGLEGKTKMFSKSPFLAALLLVSLTEWGDKTQIAAGLLAARYDPAYVLAGTMLSLTIVSLMAVLGGRMISRYVKPEKTGKIAAAVFILLGIGILVF